MGTTGAAGTVIRSVDGKTPEVDESAWIAPGAALVGDVRLLAGASVWFNSVLRSEKEHIEIGVDSNLQDGVVCHTDTGHPLLVGARVSVGHRAVLHGCTVGDDCLIGMGAVVLNGATIGAGSLVAAGTVVLEGTEVPPGSLVAGVPGKVRRTLNDDERQAIVRNGETYVGLREMHAAED